MMNLEKLRKAIDPIHGWLSDAEGQTLYSLVKDAPNVHIVEVGAWKGKSTAWLLIACDEYNKVLMTVDHFRGSAEHVCMYGTNLDTYPEFKSNIDRIMRDFDICEGRLNVMKMESTEAAKTFDPESIGMIFIDGAHENELVEKDLIAWYPKVAKDGIIVMHDSRQDGPAKVLSKFSRGKYIGRTDTLAWWRK